MTRRIEDYAAIGNCETMALVGIDGSIDWMCLPRFDSPACFAALLGDERNGRWLIAPVGAARSTRRYRGDTLILETIFETEKGSVRVVDFMHRRDRHADLIRIVCGVSGVVAMETELVVRFDYGAATPWVTRMKDGRLDLTAGPDRLSLDTTVELRGEDFRTIGEFEVREGQEIGFVLSWSRSFRTRPEPLAASAALHRVRSVLDRLGVEVQAGGRVVGRGAALAADAEGADPLGDRRRRRRSDDIAAREPRRIAQLGLPLLLAARRRLHALRPDGIGLSRRGRRMARLAAARRRRQP